MVGLPALIILGGIALLWWRSLTPEEKADWERDSSSKRDIGGGSGVTFIINIIFLILIWLSGNLDTPLSNIPYSYLIHTYLFILIVLKNWNKDYQVKRAITKRLEKILGRIGYIIIIGYLELDICARYQKKKLDSRISQTFCFRLRMVF